MTRFNTFSVLAGLCLFSAGVFAQQATSLSTPPMSGPPAPAPMEGPPAPGALVGAPTQGAPAAMPASAPAQPASATPPMSPAEIQAAENLNRQVADHYLQANGGAGTFTAPPAPNKPRSGIKPPPASISVKPGVNVLFGIAQGHLNRLVTPFRNPVVKTTSAAATSIEKNIVYVSTSNSEPVGFYIHDANDPMDAISVTMVPADIPPISVTLNLDGYSSKNDVGAASVAGDSKLANTWETSTPFVEMLKSSFRDLAKGKIPDGYSFEPINSLPATMPHCAMPGLRIVPRQILTGFNVQIIVSRVTNISDVAQDINEKSCDADQVLAVASWPNTTVPARAEDELYIAVRKPEEQASDEQRPSLLSGGAR
jgi:conjugal transfer pilus assembly protein TraK